MLVAVLLGVLPFVLARRDCGRICDYVHRDDGHFSYDLVNTHEQAEVTTYVFRMTSQYWLDETASNHPEWWHYVAVHIPHTIRFPDRAFMYIGGSNNNAGPPGPNSGHVRETGVYAARAQMVTAVIRQTPNQPIFMNGALLELSEDGLIAWTWHHYMDSHPSVANPEILLRFPMCKGAKRAFDLMQEFVEAQIGNQLKSYMVAGESKRGWTTWMMGVVDERVEAMAPVVLSCLNLNQALGNWPYAFTDYWLHNITSFVDSPDVHRLEAQVDPYRFKEWLDMPKLMVSGVSDEFFMPDDYHYFFDDLIGEKFIWLLENTGHSIGRSPLNAQYWEMLETFYIAVIEGHPFPEFSWDLGMDEEGGWINLSTQEDVLQIEVFSAITPEMVRPRRDFRLSVLDLEEGINIVDTDIEWTSSPVETNRELGQYRAYFNHPDPADQSYLAFFIKVTFPWADEDRTFTFTSEIQILPGGFPFEDCHGTDCFGFLV